MLILLKRQIDFKNKYFYLNIYLNIYLNFCDVFLYTLLKIILYGMLFCFILGSETIQAQPILISELNDVVSGNSDNPEVSDDG